MCELQRLRFAALKVSGSASGCNGVLLNETPGCESFGRLTTPQTAGRSDGRLTLGERSLGLVKIQKEIQIHWRTTNTTITQKLKAYN